MQAKDVVVRLQALDGVWEVCGVDRKRGITPENVVLEADQAGPSKATFDLRRDPGRPWPDLGAFTPVEIDVAGKLVWSGRISETPIRRGGETIINVQCQGWQFHLDDDVYERLYAHTKLGDWKDARSFLGADLTSFTAAQTVTESGRAILIAYPSGQTNGNTKNVGVGIDLGPNVLAKRVVVTYDRSFARPNLALDIMSSSTGVGTGLSTVASTGLLGSGSATGQTLAGTISAGSRYLTVKMGNAVGGDFNDATDSYVRITSIQLFGETTYESGNASTLKASTVIGDALDRATMLLSSDRTGIEATAFNIPDFSALEPRTPREVIEAVNAYHDYVGQVDVEKRMIFKAKPSAPVIETGAWAPLEDEDASANSGEEIYSRVVVSAQTPAGAPIRVARSQGQLNTTSLYPISSPAATNPSFDTNTAGWTAEGSTTIARTTVAGEFDSAPAGGKWTNPFTGMGFIKTTFTGTFRRGVTYVVEVRIKDNGGFTATGAEFGVLGTVYGTGVDSARITPAGGATFTSNFIAWTPSADRTGVEMRIGGNAVAAGSFAFIDTLNLYESRPTLVDRRRFQRTKILQVRAPLPSDGGAAQQIGDTWLGSHKLTPFKGTGRLIGPTAVRQITNGAPVPLERLLGMTGHLIRFSDRTDPDTGGHARDGRIVAVTYEPAKDEARITLDSSRAGIEALLERLAVVTGAT